MYIYVYELCVCIYTYIVNIYLEYMYRTFKKGSEKK